MSFQDNTLSARALAALRARSGPPPGNTGVTFAHRAQNPAQQGFPAKRSARSAPAGCETAPPLPDAQRPVPSRWAKRTAPAMDAFLQGFFFDWLTITVPNSISGKGVRPLGDEGAAMVREAENRLALWAMKNRLFRGRLGNGTDGYRGAANLVDDPTASERVATIRTGHATNMPGLELPGADGRCATLARSALADLGPVLVARADASRDQSVPGLWDALLGYARENSRAAPGDHGLKPPRLLISETGRTFYWGSDGVKLKVYEKDLERVAAGKLDADEADPHLVRVEFSFSPSSKRKAAFAALSPGDMVRTSVWARRFAEYLARLLGEADERDVMAKQRVSETPDPVTVEERAQRGLAQYAGTIMAAAASRIVHRDHGGDWWSAPVSPDEVEAEAVALVVGHFREHMAADDFLSRRGLLSVADDEERALVLAEDLRAYMTRQVEATEAATKRLREALLVVPKGDQGPEGPESSAGSSSGEVPDSGGSPGGSSGGASGESVAA